MTSYDWPVGGKRADDPDGRSGHLRQFRPLMDPEAIVDLPLPARRRRGRVRGVPHNAPVGNQNLWFPIGPSVMTNGQATGKPNVAGRIRDIAVDRLNDNNRVYAATAAGGVWFSGDRGQSWRPLDDWQESPDRADIGTVANSLACGAVHVIWGTAANGSQDEVWVGTGEIGGAGGTPGGKIAGIGLLHAVGPAASGAWQVLLKDSPAANPESLKGHAVIRIVGDPDNEQQLFAATTNGLYFKPPAGTWARFAPWPIAKVPIDVVVTRRPANTVRIWVAERSALWVTEFTGPAATPINPVGLVFTQVRLDDMFTDPAATRPAPKDTRLALAASPDSSQVFVLARRLRTATETNVANPPAQVWSIDATAAIVGVAGTKLAGTPPELFGPTAPDQSNYDMCICAHPTAGRIYIGGSYVRTEDTFDAAIYRCDTTTTDVNPTPIGEGVHADVHVLRVGPPGPVALTDRTVWVGCDGGVYRSDDDGDARTFGAYNDGLAVLQPGYVASHPTNAGIVAAGFQDNGTAVRVGDTVWWQSFGGDGGGTVFDPAARNRYFTQYIKAQWQSSDGTGNAPVLRGAVRLTQSTLTKKTSETIENDASLFYAGADAVSHGGATHLAIGTDRVWYTRDWGGSWVTLPTGTDPRSGNVDLGQDLINPLAPTAAFSDTTGSTDCCGSTHVGAGALGTGILAVKFAVPID
ncbi:MAG: hypothetical protein ABIM89_09120, partial [Mycobacteriales bacterium]